MDTDRHAGDEERELHGEPCAPGSISGAQGQGAQAAAAVEEQSTGLPGLRSWRRVYWVVFGCFLLWVFLLALLAKVFA